MAMWYTCKLFTKWRVRPVTWSDRHVKMGGLKFPNNLKASSKRPGKSHKLPRSFRTLCLTDQLINCIYRLRLVDNEKFTICDFSPENWLFFSQTVSMTDWALHHGSAMTNKLMFNYKLSIAISVCAFLLFVNYGEMINLVIATCPATGLVVK